MFALRGHARTRLVPWAHRALVRPQRATLAAKATSNSVTSTPDVTRPDDNWTATKLFDEGIWSAVKSPETRKGKKKGANTDRHRVNIVSRTLCRDIVNYIGDSLKRHEGCDLIDIFPGVGVWSKALNDVLKPRSHLLLEPDTDFYRPYLTPLLDNPGTKLLSESGIVWEELSRILTPEVLPHQTERRYSIDETPERNDTLLVTMNLGMYPKRRFRRFDSLAALVLFQIIAAIRPGALFQKYGLVRMLIWMENGEKEPLLPRVVQRRRKLAIESEISTDWVTEIAGYGMAKMGTSRSLTWYMRDQSVDYESTRMALARMEAAGIKMPKGREPAHLADYLERLKAGTLPTEPLGTTYDVDKPYMTEADELEAAYERGAFTRDSPQYTRMTRKRTQQRGVRKRWDRVEELTRLYMAARQKWAESEANGDKALRAQAQEFFDTWATRVQTADESLQATTLVHRDNLHSLLNDPPTLSWDRRWVEPLQVKPEEFFPRVPLALIDVQPKAAARVFRDMGPNSTRGGDIFDIVLRNLITHHSDNIPSLLDMIVPGAGQGVTEFAPSLKDPLQGGVPVKGLGSINTRCITQKMLQEIAEGWLKWPFSPPYHELVSRDVIEDVSDDSESVLGNMASASDF